MKASGAFVVVLQVNILDVVTNRTMLSTHCLAYVISTGGGAVQKILMDNVAGSCIVVLEEADWTSKSGAYGAFKMAISKRCALMSEAHEVESMSVRHVWALDL